MGLPSLVFSWTQFDLDLETVLVTMASSFAKMLTSRNTGLLLASLGAGTIAAGYLMRDNVKISAAEKRKLYPPRYPHVLH